MLHENFAEVNTEYSAPEIGHNGGPNSWQRIDRRIVMLAKIREAKLPAAARNLAFNILSFMNEDGTCRPGVRRLQENSGINKRKFAELFDVIERLSILKIDRGRARSVNRYSANYTLQEEIALFCKRKKTLTTPVKQTEPTQGGYSSKQTELVVQTEPTQGGYSSEFSESTRCVSTEPNLPPTEPNLPPTVPTLGGYGRGRKEREEKKDYYSSEELLADSDSKKVAPLSSKKKDLEKKKPVQQKTQQQKENKELEDKLWQVVKDFHPDTVEAFMADMTDWHGKDSNLEADKIHVFKEIVLLNAECGSSHLRGAWEVTRAKREGITKGRHLGYLLATARGKRNDHGGRLDIPTPAPERRETAAEYRFRRFGTTDGGIR